MKKNIILFTSIILVVITFCGCNKDDEQSNVANAGTPVTETEVSVSEMDFEFSSRDLDNSYDSNNATTITLGSTIEIQGDGAENSEGNICISSEGTYIITGELTNGQINVKVSDTEKVQLVLNNANITCTDNSPICIEEADKVFITLAEGSNNNITDGTSYDGADETLGIDGAIYSKADIAFNGTGTLNINANYAHGIVSKDDLIIASGTYNINAVKDAIHGKDCVKINDGTFVIEAGVDGIQSDNEEDSTKGFVLINNGNFDITSGCDGIQAHTVLKIKNGVIAMNTGTGSGFSSTDSSGQPNEAWGVWESNNTSEESAKGLKAGSLILFENGECNIDSSDDSVHSDGDFQMNGGKLVLKSGDDGLHADTNVIINDGELKIKKSYEGIEGTDISVSGGKISVVASDDGFNAAGGNDGSSMGDRMGMNGFGGEGGNQTINISDGYIVVDASGDGIDSNGTINISGGTILVSGPTNGGNGAFDYGSSANITGGIAVIAGSSGMAQNFSSASNQCAFIYGYSSTQTGGTNIALTDSDGNVVVSFTPAKDYQTVVISAPNIEEGTEYSLYADGQVNDVDDNGFISSGTVSGGNLIESFTLSSSVSNLGNSSGGMGGMPGDMPGGMPGGGRPGRGF